jgi:L-serine dehydratase
MIVSIFNDVVGPVMRGPSSSHCAAALRIGRIARDLMDGQIDSVLVEFDNGGSLPATHQSQGSDMGLFGGLLGWEADDDRLPNSEQHLQQAGIELKFEYLDLADPHPNTYRLTLSSADRTHRLIAISTGGGMIEVLRIDEFKVSIGGDYDESLLWLDRPVTLSDSLRDQIIDRFALDDLIIHQSGTKALLQLRGQSPVDVPSIAPMIPEGNVVDSAHVHAVLPVRSRKGLKVPFQTCADMLRSADPETPLWRLAVAYESARSGLNETELVDKMVQIVQILRKSVQQGLAGTEYADRVLGFQSGGFERALEQGKLIDAGLLNRIVLYTTALMEVKSSMGVIVAAPTAGACAAFPAVCIATGESMDCNDEEIARAMLAGGMVGVFIATHWSFAAEVGGCQAEGGSAAAMSAASLVHFGGGTLEQSVGAASMAMQNMLGLICDPVANRVEVPCLGKNVMAASNAVSCANMALAGFDPVIPLDETIAAAKAVAERMPREHRCTALGGLSVTPTSLAIEKRLQACGCGTGGCHR